MGLLELLNHTCDIYHIQTTKTSPGYNLPAAVSFSYNKHADIVSQICHFGIKGSNATIVQLEPQANYEAKIKLTLPIGTDVRLNDKIIDCSNGYEYTAEIPRNIRNHHITVLLHRTKQQEAL